MALTGGINQVRRPSISYLITLMRDTGGKPNKMVGHIGDTPQMGGFWTEEWGESRLVRRVLNKLHGQHSVHDWGVQDGNVDVNLPVSNSPNSWLRIP